MKYRESVIKQERVSDAKFMDQTNAEPCMMVPEFVRERLLYELNKPEHHTRKDPVILYIDDYILLIFPKKEADHPVKAISGIEDTYIHKKNGTVSDSDEDEILFGEWWHSIRELCWNSDQ